MFPELRLTQALADRLVKTGARIETLTTVTARGQQLPVLGFALGSTEPNAPTLLLQGGVHGLERIGTSVVLAYLRSLAARMEWCRSTQDLLGRVRLLSVPLLNPAGFLNQTRANGAGVDLMRNAPIESPNALPFFGGQRLSPKLAYYRGEQGQAIQPELRALIDFLKKYASTSPVTLMVDVHSGFGMMDRVWFPYAREHKPIAHLPETFSLIRHFVDAYPNHVYKFEPTSSSYHVHGDLSDYLYDEAPRTLGFTGPLIPLTLEMGSWLWMRKNPLQAFSFLGPFNPVKPHRTKRVLRRHLPFFDFLLGATDSHECWSKLAPEPRARLHKAATRLWYKGSKA